MSKEECRRPLYRNVGFVLLSSIQGVSQYSEFTYLMAIIWAVTCRTESPVLVSLVLMCNILPGLLLSPVAGTIVDRFDRRGVILAANLARTVLAGALLYAAGLVSLGLLYGTTLLMSFLARLFAPAHLALLPTTARVLGGGRSSRSG